MIHVLGDINLEGGTNMSKKHNNYSKMFDNEVKPDVIDTPSFENASTEVEEVKEVEETIETTEAAVVKFGVVNCERLNVRQRPNKDSMVVMVVKKNDKVLINVDESTIDFYNVEVKVGDRAVNGYCMKPFIDAE